jgi:hypothetical protein
VVAVAPHEMGHLFAPCEKDDHQVIVIEFQNQRPTFLKSKLFALQTNSWTNFVRTGEQPSGAVLEA